VMGDLVTLAVFPFRRVLCILFPSRQRHINAPDLLFEVMFTTV
jgi:hypothetical protein